MLKFKCIMLCLLLTGLTAKADAVKIDPDITTVVTSTNGWGTPRYRVSFRQVGFEHVSTEVQLDWLGEAENSENNFLVTHSETIVAVGFHTLSSARFFTKKGKQYLELKGVHTYSYQKERLVFVVEPDGVVKQIKPRLDNQ
jgi:hypothetical protein